MKHFEFDGYKMTLQDTGRVGEYGKARVVYTFSTPSGDELFSGDDLFCSPMHGPESLENAKALLSFLTLKPGDTDSEWFDKYTEKQLEFANSFDCEQLQIYTLDD